MPKLNTTHTFTQKLAYAISTIIVPILVLRKMRHREGELLNSGHVVGRT